MALLSFMIIIIYIQIKKRKLIPVLVKLRAEACRIAMRNYYIYFIKDKSAYRLGLLSASGLNRFKIVYRTSTETNSVSDEIKKIFSVYNYVLTAFNLSYSRSLDIIILRV